LLDLIHRHQRGQSSREESEVSEESHAGKGDSSLISLSSQPSALSPTEADRCATWLYRYIRGRYPKLADVRATAATAGFSAAIVEVGLQGPDLMLYRAFPRRNAHAVERVRTVDDWPDDPPLAAH
jgi:hypothetical protein